MPAFKKKVNHSSTHLGNVYGKSKVAFSPNLFHPNNCKKKLNSLAMISSPPPPKHTHKLNGLSILPFVIPNDAKDNLFLHLESTCC